MDSNDLVTATSNGLYCAPGDFYIDPWKAVENAVITHAHGDHLRAGSQRYYAAAPGAEVVRHRLPPDTLLEPVAYGRTIEFGAVRVSFHPAGHILGSAQIKIEHQDRVWVVSGDYKRDADPTCEPFAAVPCDVFVSEATFALPAYRWAETAVVAGEILEWWRRNRERGVASVLFAYALGKAQRILAELALRSDDAVEVHGADASLVDIYLSLIHI